MADYLESVKTLAKNYRVWASQSRSKNEIAMADRQIANAVSLDNVITELEELRRVTKPIPQSYGDVSDLPPELLKELTGIKVDELEQQLFNIIKAGGAEVELDSVLIELFRRHKIIQTRRFMQNKLWRMAQKGLIRSVQGKKGLYSATAEGGFGSPKPPVSNGFGSGGFADDLDDDVPF